MKRLLPILLLWCLGACSENTPPTVPATKEAPATPVKTTTSDCDYRTKLVPGIPGSPGNLIPSERNPNGVSELAQLMRQFVDDLEQAKTTLAAGKVPKKLHPTHRRMRCSWHTVPSERNKAFDLRAQAHLAAVMAFDEKPQLATYNAIIQSCIACHSVSCQGPISFLQRMQWQ